MNVKVLLGYLSRFQQETLHTQKGKQSTGMLSSRPVGARFQSISVAIIVITLAALSSIRSCAVPEQAHTISLGSHSRDNLPAESPYGTWPDCPPFSLFTAVCWRINLCIQKHNTRTGADNLLRYTLSNQHSHPGVTFEATDALVMLCCGPRRLFRR